MRRFARTRIGILFAAGVMALTPLGCVTESESGPSRGIEYRPVGDFTNGARSNEDLVLPEPIDPIRFEGETVFRAALVAPLGVVDFNGQTLPLVNPSGGHIAVQTGPPVPWDTLLARPGGAVPDWTSIVIYRIEQGEDRRLRLVESHRLTEVGLLGSSADNLGFIVEAPQRDGSRWVGKVAWETGEVEWLLQQRVNAFAAIGPGGRLAWCRRDVDSPRFDLFVQDRAGVHRLPSESGEWLMPVWAGDGQTLFAFHQTLDFQNEGLLEIVAMNTAAPELMRAPMTRRPLVESSNRYIAYQTVASIQDPIPWDATTRMLFFHPGYGRVCMIDPARPGIRLLTPDSVGGAWSDDGYAILSTDKAVFAQDIGASRPPIELVAGRFMPRRTTSALQPYLLFGPTKSSPNQLQVWAMQVINDPEAARAAER
ncbi:MAG: hypothetical protein ACF8PN_02070 [Phycisphaerales bacterium]